MTMAMGAPTEEPSETSRLTTVHDGTTIDEIRYVNFKSCHMPQVQLLTLLEFPFPENVLAVGANLFNSCQYAGVVALDRENKVAGYFLGKKNPSKLGVGSERKTVGNLSIVCVSSKHQKKGISKTMGKYMLEGKHPSFQPEDYDEILLQDTDIWNSPSWLFSDRNQLRYCPTHEMIRLFGIVGYVQIILAMNHALPCQFMKRYVHTEEEAKQADVYETQKGVLACLVSGILPPLYWICHWLMQCGNKGGVQASFAGWVYLVVYAFLGLRFSLAQLSSTTNQDKHKIVFREYDHWWMPLPFVWPIAVFVGIPLLGWSGGFYLGTPGVNYLQDGPKQFLAMAYLPINVCTGIIFLLHCIARIVAPSILLAAHGLFDVVGYAAFFFSLTDLAMPIVCFPSGAVAIRRWKFGLFVLLWVFWCIVLVCSIVLPDKNKAPAFLDLTHAACNSLD